MSRLEAHLEDQADGGEHFFWHRLRWKLVAEQLPADRPFELLDVGAGAGVLGELLARDRPLGRYHFVEPIPALESRLERRFGAGRNLKGDGPCPSIDFVTLLDVLEHQDDDRTFLTTLLGRFAPGTTMVITVPASMRLWSAWDEALGHRRRYDRDSLQAVLGGLPFAVSEVSYLFPELVPPALWRAWRSRRQLGSSDESGEFPQLPRVLDNGLYAVGRLSSRARRRSPFGSSLLAVGQVR
jgi:hypothetical protein